jgi:hypothetical protein
MDELVDYGYRMPQLPGIKRYFTEGMNAGFHSASLPSTYSKAAPAIRRVVDLLGDLFSSEQYTSVEVNVLEAQGEIREHTDQSSAVTSTGINEKFGTLVHQWHSVHIPLTGEGIYFFRRDPRMVAESLTMPKPGVYLFNNYVQHSVKNVGGTSRMNMILHFNDPQWLSKRRIYAKHQLKGMY